MATSQTWSWAAHIESKDNNTLICNRCKKEQSIPVKPKNTIPKKKRRLLWLDRIKSIGTFVTKHRYCS